MKHILFTISILLFSSYGCQNEDCEQHLLADLTFTEEELAINPYSGDEELKYKSEDGTLVEFSPGSRTITKLTTYEIDSETANIDFNGCQGNYFYSENDRMVKIDTVKNTIFKLELSFLYQIGHPTNEKGLFLLFSFNNNNHLNFLGRYKFNTDTIITKEGSRDSVITYHSQYILGGNTFFKVYELYGHHEDVKDSAWISTVYYSISDGLLGFKSSYGKQWILN